MGWLWSTPSTGQIPNSSPTDPTQEPLAPPQSKPERPKVLTRDEVAEQELKSFLQELEADVRPSSTKYNRVPRQPPPPSSTSPDSKNEESADSLSESLLPKTMSCREAFDAAFYCQSFGGQFNNLYRYGTIRSCSENWGDFWFCMRTRSYADEEKQRSIKNHYREKERRKYGANEVGKSSEDIWKSRDKKLEWGSAFNVPVPELEGTDEEWNRRERARRRGIVNGSLG